jgi:hypothetical protein
MESLDGDFVVRLDEQSIVDLCHPLTESLLLGRHFMLLGCCEHIAMVIIVLDTYEMIVYNVEGWLKSVIGVASWEVWSVFYAH